MRMERKRYEKMEKDIRIESQLLDLEKMVRMRIETVVRFFFLSSSLSHSQKDRKREEESEVVSTYKWKEGEGKEKERTSN